MMIIVFSLDCFTIHSHKALTNFRQDTEFMMDIIQQFDSRPATNYVTYDGLCKTTDGPTIIISSAAVTDTNHYSFIDANILTIVIFATARGQRSAANRIRRR